MDIVTHFTLAVTNAGICHATCLCHEDPALYARLGSTLATWLAEACFAHLLPELTRFK